MPSDPNNQQSISAKARARRVQQFAHYAEGLGISNAQVLDIGGTVMYWKMNLQFVPKGIIERIDIVNLPPRKDVMLEIDSVLLHSFAGNALNKSTLKQESYDVVYSNAVIEHVGNLRSQRLMAQNIQALGKYYWIQTPAKSFPIEPHFYFPFFAYLPLSVRTFLHQHLPLGFMGKEENWLEARMACEETRLLTQREFHSLFEKGDIIKERMFGFCKSYIATNMVDQVSHPTGE
ncbi:MAG: hypothetical protein R3293_15300 [Candidatus Promineifilaceae bacterium]|nr:hypothetical protein [Candidatus Promineifilaceae bacterium]